jgi:hypothetical protein
VPMCSAAGGGNTPHSGEGYYRGQPCGAMAHKLFAVPKKAQPKFQPQLAGVTLSVRDSPKIRGSVHRG